MIPYIIYGLYYHLLLFAHMISGSLVFNQCLPNRTSFLALHMSQFGTLLLWVLGGHYRSDGFQPLDPEDGKMNHCQRVRIATIDRYHCQALLAATLIRYH